MRLLVIFFLLIATDVTAQISNGYDKIYSKVYGILNTLPKDIYEANKRFPPKYNATVFDSLSRWIEAEYKVMAGVTNQKSALINASAFIPNKGTYFEPVNEGMQALFMEGATEAESLLNAVMPSLQFYRGSYAKGFLAVHDSLYKARRVELEKYVRRMLTIIEREQKYLVANSKMQHSKNDAERVQYYEAVWWTLSKLQAINQNMKFIIGEASEAVSICKQSPAECKKMEKR